MSEPIDQLKFGRSANPVTIVIAVSSRMPKEPYYRFDVFLASLRRLKAEPIVLGMDQAWYGLMTKPRRVRKFLREKQFHADTIILADAWDTVFVEHPDEIARRYRAKFGDQVVFNAERSCFPRGDLQDKFPKTDTPWKYPNSGFIIGPPDRILTLIEHMNIDAICDDSQLADGSWFNPNDQEYYTLAWLDAPVPVALDTRAELCLCGNGLALEDLDLTGPKIINKVTNTQPCVFHFNGGSKNDVMPPVLAKLGL